LGGKVEVFDFFSKDLVLVAEMYVIFAWPWYTIQCFC